MQAVHNVRRNRNLRKIILALSICVSMCGNGVHARLCVFVFLCARLSPWKEQCVLDQALLSSVFSNSARLILPPLRFQTSTQASDINCTKSSSKSVTFSFSVTLRPPSSALARKKPQALQSHPSTTPQNYSALYDTNSGFSSLFKPSV